jgi:hypothetical protein
MLTELLRTPLREVVLSGGAARSKLWPQILADVLGLDIHVPDVTESAAAGAAALAGLPSVFGQKPPHRQAPSRRRRSSTDKQVRGALRSMGPPHTSATQRTAGNSRQVGEQPPTIGGHKALTHSAAVTKIVRALAGMRPRAWLQVGCRPLPRANR